MTAAWGLEFPCEFVAYCLFWYGAGCVEYAYGVRRGLKEATELGGVIGTRATRPRAKREKILVEDM